MKSLGLKAAALGLPVSQKILGISAICSLVTLLALCSLSFYRDTVNFKERKISELNTLSRILESNTVASLRFNDPLTAKEYVDSMQHEPDFRSVCIYFANGEPFAFFGRERTFEPYPAPQYSGAQWQDHRLYFARDIELDGRAIGKILFELDTDSLQASISRSLWTSVALVIAGLGITLLLAYRLQRLITGPVNELVEVTKSISQQRAFTSYATKRYDDEIGSLVDSFNAMLKTLSEQDATLRANNSTLERTVQERTEDLRLRNEALERAMEAANAASIAKSEFLAMASHELRTPLNPIIGYVDLLLRQQPDLDDARKLELIKQSAKLLLRLIDDILDFSRIERGDIRLEPDAFDFRNQTEQVVETMREQASKKGLDLSYEHDQPDSVSERELLVITDEIRLRQVILNLINNAIKFTNSGSIRVRSRLLPQPTGDPKTGTIAVEVADTGIGIAAADLEKLFRPFTQIDGSSTREYGGMGLGLAISSRIVNAMGGSITCQSEKGVGSRFSFEIPVEIGARERADDAPVSDTEDLARDILLVEDEPVNRELMGALLASMGHRIVPAIDGVVAMQRYQEKHFHLVLLDISMPRMDGFATARAIRSLESGDQRIPIIAMTAHVTPEDKEKCFLAGMDDYLSKPLSLSKLRSTLQKWLPDRPSNRHNLLS